MVLQEEFAMLGGFDRETPPVPNAFLFWSWRLSMHWSGWQIKKGSLFHLALIGLRREFTFTPTMRSYSSHQIKKT